MTDDETDETLRNGISEADAPSFLQTILPGRYEVLQEHESGGWLIEVNEIDRFATDLITDQDVFFDHFCEIELDQGGDDAADIVECILTGREPDTSGPGILLCCEFRRRIGRETGFSSVDGRIAIVPDELWEATLAAMRHEHGVRCLESTITQVHHAALSLRNSMAGIDGPVDAGDLRDSATKIIRDVMKLEERHDAARTAA